MRVYILGVAFKLLALAFIDGNSNAIASLKTDI